MLHGVSLLSKILHEQPDKLIGQTAHKIHFMKQINLFTQQIAEVKISYSHKIKPTNQLKIASSKETYDCLVPAWEDIDYRESFAVLLLSRGNRVLGLNVISKGGVSGTVTDVKTIYQAALKANASGIILAHNHPSGTLQASSADIAITNNIKKAGDILDIQVLDHIIITSEGYYSFADEGMM